MTKNKRFQYNWKTGRMKDTQSNSLATNNMRVLETIINDACYSYEKKIKELEKELQRCREWINSDKNDYELTLSFIKSKGFSLEDVLNYKKKGIDGDVE